MNNTSLGNVALPIKCLRSVAEEWTNYHYLNPTLVTAIAVLSLILGVLSTLANGLVLAAVFKTPSLRTKTNFFLTSLALTDLSMGLFICPLFFFGALKWPYHVRFPVFGMVLDFLIMQTLIGSTLNLCAISYDRHIAVKSPLLYTVIMTDKKCVSIITTIWVASTGLSALSFMDSSYEERPTVYIIPALAVPVPSITFMSYCYWKIYKVVLRQKKQIKANSPSAFVNNDDTTVVQNRGNDSARLKKERKATTTVAMIVGTFILCWLPNTLVSILHFFITKSYKCNAYTFGEFWLLSLPISFLNSLLDPLIYVLRNREFKFAIKALFLRSSTRISHLEK
ncbi:5-hydroxytryptamine receptor 1-like [Actinia tenebrosa]|uniref:5-hydroxytryptamine receptor 1-like n=1 Tax=Actinia tenebrosa TaxID=6105 RepID=A0A6P8H0A4_ACTTE|nr:5-hydroxytryptamine receptor 1-like [Actinia tenebrosa]